MPSVLQLFVNLVQLRARPQDLPARDGLLLATVVAAAIAAVLALRPFYPLTTGAARVALDLAMQGALLLFALRATGRSERFRQAFSAICGTGVIFTLLAWPLYAILVEREPDHPLAGAAVMLVLAIYVWGVVVIGHIFRHTFDQRMGVGIALALGYVVVTTVVGEALVPPPESN